MQAGDVIYKICNGALIKFTLWVVFKEQAEKLRNSISAVKIFQVSTEIQLN